MKTDPQTSLASLLGATGSLGAITQALRAKGVVAVGSEITSEQLEHAERQQRAKDDSWALHELIDAYKSEKAADRKLKNWYGIAVLVAMAVEILIAALMLILTGCGVLVLDKWVASIFFTAVFSQVAACTLAVVKNLFSSDRDTVHLFDFLGGRRRRLSKEK